VDSACCWPKEQITPGDCPYIGEGEQDLFFNRKKRFLHRCLECPRFLDDLRSRREDMDGLAELFPYVIEELLGLRVQSHTLVGQIESRNREIKFLHEVSLVLQTSVDMDEVIAMALTAVTSGKGFGLNRAFLLLVDKERQNLKGYFAVGPRRPEEAETIWREIEERDYTLKELAQLFFEHKMPSEREKFRDLLGQLSVPLSRSDHLFVRVLNEQQSVHVCDLAREPGIDPAQVSALGVRELVLVPLISKNRRIGVLMADNVINRRPIATEDLHSLKTFALPVSFAIERATLYERLQEELSKVTEANRRLKDQQDLIVRMEKMALVGKITSNIAHSIRNPLTIIGGFARTLIKNTPPEDGKRQYIESIVREVRRLEEILQEVLNYSESLHPTLDLWDVNNLITGVYAGLRDDFEMSGVTCRLQLEPGLPHVRLDYKKMAYCLRSILTNSLEVMNGKEGVIEVSTLRRNSEIHIVLADNGPGMPEETLKEITSPFFSSKERGSGLGLSLAARILEGHDAALDVASVMDKGTTFTIRLKVPQDN
jgi:signal transduction histidine kinase